MRRVMANALVTLLALLLSVGASRGEGIWVSCKVGTLEWLGMLKVPKTMSVYVVSLSLFTFALLKGNIYIFYKRGENICG